MADQAPKREIQIAQDEHNEIAGAKKVLMIGQDDIGDFVIISVNSDGSIDTLAVPQTPFFDDDGDNTVQTIKDSAGILQFLEVQNPNNNSDAYIQLFDEAGTITVGTTAPKLSLLVPRNGAMDKFFNINFANSIKYACTTTVTGSGDPTVGLIVNGGFI